MSSSLSKFNGRIFSLSRTNKDSASIIVNLFVDGEWVEFYGTPEDTTTHTSLRAYPRFRVFQTSGLVLTEEAGPSRQPIRRIIGRGVIRCSARRIEAAHTGRGRGMFFIKDLETGNYYTLEFTV